ncbi:MAG TPA: serine/threonine-protein kinase, partial [Bacteroidota bacterium]|nr:serine/threonine-protein kinase [Bacteroidota bacterium]
MIGQTISHYKILEKLGEGGMGVVYKAEDTRLQRDVALKFLPPEMTFDKAAKRRFVHEAQAASGLDHPNIAVVHEVDETRDGRSFICMTYYPGETLRQKIDRGSLGVNQAVEITIQIAEGLRRAHGAGIVHRDIKPANVLVTNEGVVKIVDFGLAKLVSDTRSSKSGRLAGTAAYMSPEQVRGEAADRRNDLFSLGVVLYEMIAGVRPFIGDYEAAIFYSILHLEPEPISKLRPEIPPAVVRIIDKLLRKDPQSRYQDAGGLVDDLNALRSGVRPAATGRFTNALRSPRSRPRTVVSVLGLIVLVGIFSWVTLTRITHSSFRFEPSKYVVVADFENQTGDSVFNHSLTQAMKVALRQSAYLNLMSSDRIPEALQRMRLSADHRLDETTALSLARREGGAVLVAGNISQLGTSYVLTCKIIDPGSGELLELLHREVPRVESVLSEMDALCKDIRERLGESLRAIAASAKPLEQATTASL